MKKVLSLRATHFFCVQIFAVFVLTFCYSSFPRTNRRLTPPIPQQNWELNDTEWPPTIPSKPVVDDDRRSIHTLTVPTRRANAPRQYKSILKNRNVFGNPHTDTTAASAGLSYDGKSDMSETRTLRGEPFDRPHSHNRPQFNQRTSQRTNSQSGWSQDHQPDESIQPNESIFSSTSTLHHKPRMNVHRSFPSRLRPKVQLGPQIDTSDYNQQDPLLKLWSDRLVTGRVPSNHDRQAMYFPPAPDDDVPDISHTLSSHSSHTHSQHGTLSSHSHTHPMTPLSHARSPPGTLSFHSHSHHGTLSSHTLSRPATHSSDTHSPSETISSRSFSQHGTLPSRTHPLPVTPSFDNRNPHGTLSSNARSHFSSHTQSTVRWRDRVQEFAKRYERGEDDKRKKIEKKSVRFRTLEFRTVRERFQKLYRWWQARAGSDVEATATNSEEHLAFDIEDQPHIIDEGAHPGFAISNRQPGLTISDGDEQCGSPISDIDAQSSPPISDVYRLPFEQEPTPIVDYEEDVMKSSKRRQNSGARGNTLNPSLSENWEIPLIVGPFPNAPIQDSSTTGSNLYQSTTGTAREYQRWDFSGIGVDGSELYVASTDRTIESVYETVPNQHHLHSVEEEVHPLQQESYF